MTRNTIIFIASELRSGSTLLDVLLSNHRDITSVGEIDHLQNYLTLSPVGPGTTRNWVCRCGERFSECSFWSQIARKHLQETQTDLSELVTASPAKRRSLGLLLASLLILVAPRKYGIRLNQMLYSSDRSREAAENCYTVLDHVRDVTGGHVFIDSSKNAENLFALKSYPNANYRLKVIHIVRDGRAVAHSIENRSKEKNRRTNYTKVVANWAWTNLLIHNLKALFDDSDFIRIRHEDLCTDTKSTIERVCEHLGLPFDPIMTELTDDERHNIGGTPRQFSGKTSIALDERWKTETAAWKRAAFFLVGGAANKLLGY